MKKKELKKQLIQQWDALHLALQYLVSLPKNMENQAITIEAVATGLKIAGKIISSLEDPLEDWDFSEEEESEN